MARNVVKIKITKVPNLGRNKELYFNNILMLRIVFLVF